MSPVLSNNTPPNHTGILKDNFNKIVNWDILDDDALEVQVFTTSSTMNAVGQVISSTSPDGSVHRPTFSYSGELKKVEVKLKGSTDFDEYVSNIEYSEKGLRTSIRYGNGVNTTYAYDPITYQLKELKTSRSKGNELLQDLFYWYDPVGNVSRITDEAQEEIFFDNQAVSAINDYSYDAFYQLKSASGREHIGQTAFTSPNDQVNPANVLPHKGDGQKMRNYERFFSYDKAGNMLLFHHKPAGTVSFKRQFNYSTGSNILKKSGIGQEQNWQNYSYDLAGNMQKMIQLNTISWNSKNEIQRIEKSNVTAFYEYDSEGERSRKIVKKGAKKLEVRYYVGDVEIFKRYEIGKPEVQLERETLHIMDDSQRIAMVDTKTIDSSKTMNTQDALVRYQLGNHLSSASIEIDDKAKVISYEEFYPYGSSSFQSVDKTREIPRKRYRYTGMERDEESGLNYHSARYYAPWLCRWLKPDPAGTVDGLNVWRYVKGSPILKIDTTGLKEYDSMSDYKKETGNTKLGKYDWLEDDRTKSTSRWDSAMRSITKNQKQNELAPFGQIRDYYLWVQKELNLKGHEIKWVFGASMLVEELTDSFEEGATWAGWFVNDNTINLLRELNLGIANFAIKKFHSLLYGKHSKTPLKGDDAFRFDEQFITEEQGMVAFPIYEKYSKGKLRGALVEINGMVRGNVGKFKFTGIMEDKAYYVPSFAKYGISLLTSDRFGQSGRIEVPLLILYPERYIPWRTTGLTHWRDGRGVLKGDAKDDFIRAFENVVQNAKRANILPKGGLKRDKLPPMIDRRKMRQRPKPTSGPSPFAR